MMRKLSLLLAAALMLLAPLAFANELDQDQELVNDSGRELLEGKAPQCHTDYDCPGVCNKCGDDYKCYNDPHCCENDYDCPGKCNKCGHDNKCYDEPHCCENDYDCPGVCNKCNTHTYKCYDDPHCCENDYDCPGKCNKCGHDNKCYDDPDCCYTKHDCDDGLGCTVDACRWNTCKHYPNNKLCAWKNKGNPCKSAYCNKNKGCQDKILEGAYCKYKKEHCYGKNCYIPGKCNYQGICKPKHLG